MKKFILLIFLLNIILKISCQDVKLGKTIEQKLEEDDDLNSYEEDHARCDRPGTYATQSRETRSHTESFHAL